MGRPAPSARLEGGVPQTLASPESKATLDTPLRRQASTRARELRAAGKSHDEILKIMNSEGFSVVNQ